MRKVTNQIKEAFLVGKSLTVSNTRTDGQSVWLYGNKIIEKRPDGIYATMSGWNTPTTRERLNGITNGSFNQKSSLAYFNDVEISPSDWVKVS